MTMIPTKKLLLSSAIALALTGCGGSDDSSNSNKNVANTPPTQNGDITVNMSEKDAFRMVDLLKGTADKDGDILRVRNLKASQKDQTGFDTSQMVRIGVSPSKVAPLLDTGDTLTMVYTFDVSDGQDSVARKATINITGEDSAPTFDNLFVLVDTPDKKDIDLLEGVTDEDGEPLSVSDFTPAANLQNGLYTVDADTGILSLDITTILDGLAPGKAEVFRDNTYNVKDHNHSLARKATFVVIKTTDTAAPPVVVDPATVSVDTNSPLKMLDLASPAYALDPNGDQIVIDWSSFTPTDGGPALTFNRSEGTQLGVDGIDFGSYVNDGETKTFTYSYDFSDGDNSHTVSNTVAITVTGKAAQPILSNGGFENGLDGWGVTDSVSASSTSAFGLDFSGSAFAALTAGDTLSTSIPGNALETGAGYIFEARGALENAWGGYAVNVSGDVGDTTGAPLNSVSWFAHGANPRTYAVSFTGAPNTKVKITTDVGDKQNAAEYDDAKLYKYSTDPGNNLISKDDSTFDNGKGDWLLGAGASITDGSLNGGTLGDKRNILPLPAGTIKNGKRYLLTMDVSIDDYSAPTKFRASILDPSDASNETTATGGAYTGIFELNGATNRFATIIDPDRDTSITDWASRAVQLHIGTNVWGAGKVHHIDNVRLIELP